MKHFLKLLLIIVLAIVMSVSIHVQEKLELRIARGKVDTVSSKTHYIVGVAPKGAKILLNDCKGYLMVRRLYKNGKMLIVN